MFGQREITGKVTDADNGDPLIGVNILVVGTSSGSVTDFDGSYTLRLPQGSNVLEFSYTGYTTQRITVGASTLSTYNLRRAPHSKKSWLSAMAALEKKTLPAR
jgi:iron complex outermembrane receptor protein